MIKLITSLPFTLLLMGCQSEKVGSVPWGSILISDNHICFSLDNLHELNGYIISSTQKNEYKEFSKGDLISLYYPGTCLNIILPLGYIYNVSYYLNNNKYRYAFFKDNNGYIINLGE